MLQRRASVRFMPLSLIGTLWGVSALAVAQSNGETTLAAIRAVAGESKPAIWESENPPPISITTVDSSPAMGFPIRVVLDTDGARSLSE